MTAAIQPFTFDGTDVRVVTDEQGEPWFVARDVCAVLDLGNVSMTVGRLADDERSTISSSEGGPDRLIVSEAGLYRLIFTSRKTEAETFRRWVTHEVLPTIRRTGSYIAPMTDAEKALLLAREVLSLNERVAELAPRAQVADQLLDAEGDLSVADTAKSLTRAGVKVGAGRLFSLLASMRWIYRAQGDGRWRVYQAAIDAGWMSVLPASHYHPKTGVLVLDPPQPRVTPKGLARLLADHNGPAAIGGAA